MQDSISPLFSNKALAALVAPLVVEQTLVMLVGMSDTLMVSVVGEAAISGVTLTDMVNQLVATLLAGLATGGAVVVSQYLGEKSSDKADRAGGQLTIIGFFFSLLLALLCLVGHRLILHVLFGSVSNDVMRAANTYLIITALSFPFLGVYNSGTALFRAMGKTKITMYVSLLMNVINIIGNAIGVFVFHAGVAGVAFPTLISRAFAAVLITILALDKQNKVKLKWENIFSWQGTTIKSILHMGVPAAIENGLFRLGLVLVTSIVALFGTAQIAANGVANNLNTITVIFSDALGLAAVPVIGQCVGARNYKEAKYYIRRFMLLSWIGTILLAIAVAFAGLALILPFYHLSPETNHYVFILVIMHSIMAAVMRPTAFTLSDSIRAAGDVRFTLIVQLGSMAAFRLGFSAIFGIVFHLGVIGVFIAMGADWFCRSVCFITRYKHGKWRESRAI
jgi:putative MATE family efflux protein